MKKKEILKVFDKVERVCNMAKSFDLVRLKKEIMNLYGFINNLTKSWINMRVPIKGWKKIPKTIEMADEAEIILPLMYAMQILAKKMRKEIERRI